MADTEESPADRRLRMLEKVAGSAGAEPFARYALALEYRRRQRHTEALSVFDALRAAHADYLPMYLMAGQMLLETGAPAQAREWLEQGVAVASRQGDHKALSELESALAETE
jgi:predicted Zn-dependent protease